MVLAVSGAVGFACGCGREREVGCWSWGLVVVEGGVVVAVAVAGGFVWFWRFCVVGTGSRSVSVYGVLSLGFFAGSCLLSGLDVFGESEFVALRSGDPVRERWVFGSIVAMGSSDD